MPSRIIITNVPSSSGKPVLQEQRTEWFFDASKCTKVLPSASSCRTAQGAMVAVPSLYNGDATTVAFSLAGNSYQTMAISFTSPIDWVEVTARAESRVPGCGMTFPGAVLPVNIVPEFTSSRIVTKQYKVPRSVGVLSFGTAAGAGAFRFHEIVGWAELP